MAQETKIQFQVESYQRLKKMVLDPALLNTQYYKIQIKSKVEQSEERSRHPPLHLNAVANEKGALEWLVETI